MAKIHQIYKQLQHVSDPSVDRAMAAALPTADRLARRLMGLMLLHRRHPEGLVALIAHYHLFSPDIQHTIAGHAHDMFGPLRQAAAMTRGNGPLNAISIIHRSHSARLAYLAAEQLRSGSSEAQCAAGACLLHLARHAVSDPRPGVMPRIEPVGAAYLRTAITDAVAASARHDQRSVLVAAAWLIVGAQPKLINLLADQRHPAAFALAALVDEGDQPAIVRHLMALVAIPTLTTAALTGLRRAAERQDLGPMLAEYHLLALPTLAPQLARVEQPEAMLLSDARARALAPHEARGLAPWIMCLPLELGDKIQRLAQLHRMPDPAARLMALRRLMALSAGHQSAEASGDGALDAVALFTDDPDPQFARIALHHLVRRRYAGLTRLLMRLINSPHESLRRYATQRLAPLGFARLWDAWPKLDPSRRLVAGRALLKIDANGREALADKLRRGDQPAKLRALGMITELGEGGRFEAMLNDLARGADEVLASAAVRALGTADSETAVATLEQALRHNDKRVRANAIEALGQVRSTRDVSRHVQQLAHIAEEDENRPRASAIGAMLEMKAGDALPALTRMLEDPRPEHRVSALYLVEHMGVLQAARTVAELAATDADPLVRRRAAKVAREMLELMGSVHRDPAPV